MSAVLHLDANGGAHITGTPATRAARTPRQPANAGHGDVRKGIVPVVKFPPEPAVKDWEGGALIDLAAWLEAPRAGGGLLLQGSDDALALEGKLDGAALVAVDFRKLNDGRGYSTATLLRQRLGYRGPLRAVGAVTADQVFALARVGFDSFVLREDQDADVALAALKTFSVSYPSTTAGRGAIAEPEGAQRTARVTLLERSLKAIAAEHQNAALASSLSAEDMVITDVIARLGLPITVFTLDTGRLHAETVSLIEQVKDRYGLDVEVFRPDPTAVDLYVRAFGIDGFYDGVEQRKLCCRIRKVEPLNRALTGRDAWITGQRREQALGRAELREREHDGERDIAKYNPLAGWSWAEVLDYAARHDVPMSPLYARGYVSIGCEPCTKAVRPGEDPRAGRWWWENQDTKECGLHTPLTTTS